VTDSYFVLKFSSTNVLTNALAISDYGFGVATPVEVRALSARVKHEIPVTLDSRHRLGDFQRAALLLREARRCHREDNRNSGRNGQTGTHKHFLPDTRRCRRVVRSPWRGG